MDSASSPTELGPASSLEAKPSPQQRAFLLQQLASAPGRTLGRGEANQKIPATVVKALDLKPAAATRLRDALADEELIRVTRAGRNVTYELTERGEDALRSLEPYVAPSRRGGPVINPPANEKVRRERDAYLLLQLLKADRHTLAQGEANAFDRLGKEALELNAATARQLRHALADRGLVTVARRGRSEVYTLTGAGRLELGAMAFSEDFEFKLKGRILNDLLEAARESAKQFERPEPVDRPSPAAAAASPDDLARAVLREFEDLRREKHHVSGMVPIHEVRQRIRARFGPEAARHGVLDEVILGLWRGKQLRLASISDREKATEDQLQESIPGVGETLFFLESAHESALL